MLEVVTSYFDGLSATQLEQLAALDGLYREWNEKINVVSRKDIDNLYVHHVLHSLAFAKVGSFKAGAKVLDVGTGGGFPGIPLAILFPDVQFELVDSIRKKITVVEGVADALGLTNVKATWGRVEELKTRYDFVVTRAVTSLSELKNWCGNLLATREIHAIPNGLWAWKGLPTLEAEIAELPKSVYTEIYPMSDYFKEDFFETKGLVYMQW